MCLACGMIHVTFYSLYMLHLDEQPLIQDASPDEMQALISQVPAVANREVVGEPQPKTTGNRGGPMIRP